MEYHFVISGEIGVAFDWWTGQRGTTAKDIRNFLNAHKGEEVHIAVSSPGGFVDAGLEIYQLIKDHGHVHIHILGMTASAATFLTMGAQSIDMVEGSLMLIHNASTAVMEWQRANKEQLDSLISKFQKEREDLNTIDKVIASLYAKKSGRSLDDCMDKMNKAAWLSPADALEFGLIDEVRADDEGKSRATNMRKLFSNHITAEFGLPPLPSAIEQPVVDREGNPTKSFIQKSVDEIKAIFAKQSAKKIQTNMIKVFLNVMEVLSIKDGFQPGEDDSVSLTQDQLKTVDERLGSLKAEVQTAKDAESEAKKQLDTANAELTKTKDELVKLQNQLDELKGAPAVETQGQVTDGGENDEGDFLKEARNSFNAIKDL
ncbi:ATP-dependent Clp protease proteolytic subunit [Segatella buccae]|uniref:Clp protease ClpP n=1 Tax=Segatella buccae TaxID=28126 RepID=UPI0028D23DA0|nr:ATP-dependent Clp protease proteolytic subunit [Segatella buccae]